jgi:hypothetical protein
LDSKGQFLVFFSLVYLVSFSPQVQHIEQQPVGVDFMLQREIDDSLGQFTEANIYLRRAIDEENEAASRLEDLLEERQHMDAAVTEVEFPLNHHNTTPDTLMLTSSAFSFPHHKGRFRWLRAVVRRGDHGMIKP